MPFSHKIRPHETTANKQKQTHNTLFTGRQNSSDFSCVSVSLRGISQAGATCAREEHNVIIFALRRDSLAERAFEWDSVFL